MRNYNWTSMQHWWINDMPILLVGCQPLAARYQIESVRVLFTGFPLQFVSWFVIELCPKTLGVNLNCLGSFMARNKDVVHPSHWIISEKIGALSITLIVHKTHIYSKIG
jgi:hypothetical protein